jgi:FkbM family methyltransferase
MSVHRGVLASSQPRVRGASPLVNTRLLFLDLLRPLSIEHVCDVGSMDGRDALAFRARLPRATITAFEPHPQNFARMRADPRLGAAGIELVPWAVSDHDGFAPFYQVSQEEGATARARRGMSSLLPRDPSLFATHCIEVPTARLDGVLSTVAARGSRIALWIDVEGMAFEALEGMRRVASQVVLLHVELESTGCIHPRQKLAHEVQRLLEQLGFEERAVDQPAGHAQFNALYLRRDLDARTLSRVARRLVLARVRQRLVNAWRSHCPTLRRHVARWRNA